MPPPARPPRSSTLGPPPNLVPPVRLTVLLLLLALCSSFPLLPSLVVQPGSGRGMALGSLQERLAAGAKAVGRVSGGVGGLSSSNGGVDTKDLSPVVVSGRAEALSHSASTLKLRPSYELFQVLPDREGGEPSLAATQYRLRHGLFGRHALEDDVGEVSPDPMAGVDLADARLMAKLPDPFKLVDKELQPFADSISELVSSDQPVLSMAAKHFFEKRQGKRFRPTIVQLVAKAVAAADVEEVLSPADQPPPPAWHMAGASPIPADLLAEDGARGVVTPGNHRDSDPWRRQAQLGQVVEMIHVASLIHDDVLDEAETRRGGDAVHKLYSNKVAVLAGDYLLARASVLLARLENTAVVQIMATALESLVSGEIMQLKAPPESLVEVSSYLRKSYYKTASLIAYAARSTALLGGHSYGSEVATACEEFGFHLGLAYQVQDDILDFTGAADVLGKPALADMDLGLSTAPILYAAEEFPQLKPLIMRRFKKQGDKQTALELLFNSERGMARAKELARFHADKAVEALLRLPPSEARDALTRLVSVVILRKK
ncbi:hypothetical protein TeGR_g14817 [Tetraparma gracilis]|uniref:Uncharacterized protein n=1 Tax=Tetraparma gracilis TaxID=2962635 RepID=A0ABQ6MTW2_9STRA|nr:hypothetical protein TeGR_g14817 [Tetraparma gracilis]